MLPWDLLARVTKNWEVFGRGRRLKRSLAPWLPICCSWVRQHFQPRRWKSIEPSRVWLVPLAGYKFDSPTPTQRPFFRRKMAKTTSASSSDVDFTSSPLSNRPLAFQTLRLYRLARTPFHGRPLEAFPNDGLHGAEMRRPLAISTVEAVVVLNRIDGSRVHCRLARHVAR